MRLWIKIFLWLMATAAWWITAVNASNNFCFVPVSTWNIVKTVIDVIIAAVWTFFAIRYEVRNDSL